MLVLLFFFFIVMLVFFILPNTLFCSKCSDTLWKVKPGTKIAIGDFESCLKNRLLLKTLKVAWVSHFKQKSNNKYCTLFFICNVYSSVNRLHGEKTTVMWCNFCFYSVQYCTVSVEYGKLTWILCYIFCFVMECNWTIRPLYFKNTLFFTSIYLYVSMYDVQKIKKKTNVYFLYLSLHVLLLFFFSSALYI